MPGLYFEELTPGLEIAHPWGRTVTEADNIMFSCLTLNPQPLHIDADFASRSEFGKPLVNSLFTLGLLIGLSVNDTTMGTLFANLGMTDVTFPKPVFHGDTIKARTKVVSRRESKSRPNAGVVEFEHVAVNQRGEVVARCLRQSMMLKKPAA